MRTAFRRVSPIGLLMLLLGAGLLAATARLPAYGTIVGKGQNAEHHRITRRAFACTAQSPSGSCFEEKTLESLAGEPGGFGAVGAPDRGRALFDAFAHCDGADHLDLPGYPQSREQARAVLEQCRRYMVENLRHAVTDAAALLGRDGRISSRETAMTPECIYAGGSHGRAKCNVLAHLGLILHAAQDFYSHSNWVDRPDPARAPGPTNPPGLGRSGPAPWLDLRADAPDFPAGLITGCFETVSMVDERRGCRYGRAGEHRVRHANLNKDRGTIDPVIGTGVTERGAINDNFRRSVEAATADSADKWATYREMLRAAYGESRARLMICAITRDIPARDCAV